MDLVANPIPSGSICEGCLSVDRKISTVCKEESQIFLGEILTNTLDHVNDHAPSLCWECAAVVRRVVTFKEQVRRAHDYLITYMLHQSGNLTSLSKLTTTTNEPIHFIDESMKGEIDDINNVDAGDKFGTLEPNHTPLNSEGRKTAKTSRESGTPMFIKIESEGDDFNDLDGSYVDESAADDADGTADHKDLKPVLQPDPYQYEVPVTKTRSKKTKRKMKVEKVEQFSDSDDEPLTLKKQRGEEEECKPKRKRKKKENIGEQAGRARRAPAEKPAGVVDTPRVRRRLQQLNVAGGQLEMVVLSWEEVEAERARARASASFTRHQYRCADCVLGFNHKFKLTNHMVKHEPSSGALSCGVCRVRCRDAHALAAHRRRHRVRWRCSECGATWSRAAVAADHRVRAHGAPPPVHRCSACGHQAETLCKLRNHLKSHAERQKCEQCGKTFRDRASLRTHLFIHKGEKEYSCPQCDKRFLFKKAMEVHLVTHLVSEQLYCHQCDMNFKNQMSYYQHMRYNLKHIDPAKLKYACPLCDKRFAKASRLQEHHVAVHLKATPIQCTQPGCSFACSSRPVLRTHIRMIHRNVRLVRNHVCHTCGKAYTTKKILEGHMRTHTGERPFLCQQCPSTFSYEAALYNHNKLVHLKLKTGRGRAAPSAAPPPASPAAAWLAVRTAGQEQPDSDIN